MTRQLDESIRAQLDILRINIQAAKSAFKLNGKFEEVDSKAALVMNYYETGTEFYGHKFFEISPQENQTKRDFLATYGEQFIRMYADPEKNPKSVLVYTSDEIIKEKIKNAFNNSPTITFADSAPKAQGSE
jgi:hypothetical protein